jgi:hypothetical protein
MGFSGTTGFAAYWRWKSRSPGGRPPIAKEVRDLIRRMSVENPLWSATKIHGELLKLGIDVAQSTVSILHGAPAGSTMADLEDLPSQSYGRDCIDRFVRTTWRSSRRIK